MDEKIAFKEEDDPISVIKSSEYKEISFSNSNQNHHDGVRDLLFLPAQDILVSVSEDCTMKLWSIKNLQDMSCMGTIREHSGPIFTLAHGSHRVFSGGMEGIVRAWNFQTVS